MSRETPTREQNSEHARLRHFETMAALSFRAAAGDTARVQQVDVRVLFAVVVAASLAAQIRGL